MSDIFNHSLDAFESEMDYYSGVGNYGDSGCPPNPLFYFMKIKYLGVIRESNKALEISYKHPTGWGADVWIPKSIVRKRDDEYGEMYVHKKIFLSILKECAKANKML